MNEDDKTKITVFVTITPPIKNNGVNVSAISGVFNLETGEIIATGARTSPDNPPVSPVIIKTPSADPLDFAAGMVEYPSGTTWKATWLFYGSVGNNQVLRVDDLGPPYGSTQVTINVK